MKLIGLIPALLGLLFMALSIYLMRVEYIFTKKETVLTHARLVSEEGRNHIYQYQVGDQTFTFPVQSTSAEVRLPGTYPVRYLVKDPQKHEAYIRPWSGTPGHRRFNWFKCILTMLLGIFLLYGAIHIALA